MSSPGDRARASDRSATAASQTTGATVARGSIWEIAGIALPQLYVVVGSVFLARYLGPEGLGRLVLIGFVAYVVSSVFTLGLPAGLARYTALLLGSGSGGTVRTLLGWVSRVELLGAALALVVMSAAAALGAAPRVGWVLAGVFAAGSVLHAVPSMFLRGAQRWRESRVIGITSGAVALVLKIVTLMLGGGITAILAIDAAIALTNLLGTTIFARREARSLPPPDPNTRILREVLAFSAIASITIIITLVVYQRTEVFFLAWYASDSEIAIYSIPFSLVTALLLIPRAIGSALAPAVATLWGAGEVDRIRSGFSRSVRLVLVFNVVITALALALGPTVVRLLYGPAFADAGRVLVILLVTLPFVPLTALSSSLLVGIGRQWGLTIIGAAAAALNIGLDLALIPPYGAVGAAVANSIAQLAGSIPLIVYAGRVLGGVELHVAALIRAVVAAGAAALAALVVVHQLPLVVGFVAGAAVFWITLLLAGILARPLIPEDGTWVEAMAGHRAGGLIGLSCRCLSGRAPLPWIGARP